MMTIDNLFDEVEYAAFEHGVHAVKIPTKASKRARPTSKSSPNDDELMFQRWSKKQQIDELEMTFRSKVTVNEKKRSSTNTHLDATLDKTFHERATYPGQECNYQPTAVLKAQKVESRDDSEMMGFLYLGPNADALRKSGLLPTTESGCVLNYAANGGVIKGVNGRVFNRNPTIGEGDEEFATWLLKREMQQRIK